MPHVGLRGELVCRNAAEAALIAEHLPVHVVLTRQEPGCLLFEVAATEDPLIWTVEERFTGRSAFEAHQARVASSQWGRVTAGIERRYTVEDVSREA